MRLLVAAIALFAASVTVSVQPLRNSCSTSLNRMSAGAFPTHAPFQRTSHRQRDRSADTGALSFNDDSMCFQQLTQEFLRRTYCSAEVRAVSARGPFNAEAVAGPGRTRLGVAA